MRSNLIKNVLMVIAIVALGTNIVVVLSHPPRQIEARRPDGAVQPTYRAALTRQIHIAYGQELSRLHRELPDLLAMQIRLDGIEQAMDKLNDDYGPEDDWIDDHQHLLVLRQQAQEALDEAIEKHAVVKRCITELTTFGTVRFYKDEIDVQTLDRVYRGTLTTPQLEKVARDLSALVARNLLKIRGVK